MLGCSHSTYAQHENKDTRRTQFHAHLYKIDNDDQLPDALVVPRDTQPKYSLDRLAAWRCHEAMNPIALSTCAENFMSKERFLLKKLPVLKDKAHDKYGYNRYQFETTDGKQWDAWSTENGCRDPADDSYLQTGYIENGNVELIGPWGPERFNNLSYGHFRYLGWMPYIEKVAADGKVLWANVYLVKTKGEIKDKNEFTVIKNPLLAFGEVVCPKGAQRVGFVTSAALSLNITLTFGSMAIEINTHTGLPKASHKRIRVVPLDEMKQHYKRALAELIDEGVITESDTEISTEANLRQTGVTRALLGKAGEFSERLHDNLIKSYFTNMKGD